MALDRLTLAPVVLPSPSDEDLNSKAPRLPRWTRQELLVLIQGKRVAENRVRRGRTAVLAQVEPKWSSVSSYCKRHGVNRGPVQCRKRWSNLAGDFKKIKEWESQIKEEADSFWVMRNDLRRERKLPGFFDREVYDILDGGGPSPASLVLSLAPSAETTENEVVFDSGRTAAADDGLFSDEVIKEATPAAPISATEYESFSQGVPPPPPAPAPAAAQDKETSPGPQGRERDRKRKRDAAAAAAEEEEMSLEKQLIEAMERNGRLLSSQLEIQNANSQLDREQRKDEANTLFSVLNKLADAMVRIADKL
ncbi:putative transcription factor MYB family [Helianthus debilis subsp. tardiflorus]